MAQEVIIYRGPAEYAFYNSDFAFPLMAAVFAAFFVGWATGAIAASVIPLRTHNIFLRHIARNGAFYGAIIGGVITFKWLYI